MGKNSTNRQNKTTSKNSLFEAKSLTESAIALSTVGKNSTNKQNKTTWKSSLTEAESSTKSTIVVSTVGKSSTIGGKVFPQERNRPSRRNNRSKKSYGPDVIDLESEEEIIDIDGDVIVDEDFGKMEM